jgi:hypothetical protein
MLRWLMRDLGAKVGALLLAVALWLHAVTGHSYRLELDIPLIIEDPTAPAGQSSLLLSTPVPDQATVAVFGAGKDLLRTSADDLLLRLQAPVGEPGQRVILRLDAAQVESHSELELVVLDVVEPTQLAVILDLRQERLIPVRAQIQLRLSESYTQVGPTILQPDSIVVSGPLSHLKTLEAIFTDSLLGEDIRDDIDLELPLSIPEGQLLRLHRDNVRVLINVQELAEYEIPNVPVVVSGGPEGAAAEPSRVTVRVRGGADLIGSLDPESDIGLWVPYDKTHGDGGTIEAPSGKLYEIRQIIPARASIVTR